MSDPFFFLFFSFVFTYTHPTHGFFVSLFFIDENLLIYSTASGSWYDNEKVLRTKAPPLFQTRKVKINYYIDEETFTIKKNEESAKQQQHGQETRRM